MRFSIHQKISLGFGAWLLALGTLCFLSCWNIAASIREQQGISQKQEVQKQILALQSNLLHVEAAALRCLVTGEQGDLLSYRLYARQLVRNTDRLRDLLAAALPEQEPVASLDFLVTRKLTTLQQAIAARKSIGLPAAFTLVSAETVREPIPPVNRLLEAMEGDDIEALQAQRQTAASGVRRAETLAIAAIAIFLAGIPVAVFVIRREFGHIRQAEEKLRAGAFLDSVVENIPSIVFVKDAETLKFVRVNRACEEAIGYSRDELIGKNAHDIFPEEEASFLTAKDREVLQNGGLLDTPEESIPTKNMGVRILHARKIPLFDSNGKAQFLLGIAEDITELKQAREGLIRAKEDAERSNKFKDQFLSTMSHELRTPLNAVIGFSDLLTEAQYGPLNDRQKRYVNHIRTGGKHLLSLINDILDLSKIEAGRLQLSIGTVPVSLWFAEVVDSLQPLAHKKSQILLAEAPANLIARADSTRFKQILMNLIGNAIKFTPEGGSISVTAHQTGDHIRIEVRDSGPGIPPAEQQRIFEAFYRLAQSDKGAEGTGLGLAITQRLVELHGGQLGIESHVGFGSCFYFTLPAEPVVLVDQTQGLHPNLDNGEGRKILVIEDDPVAAQLLQTQLISAGYDVVICDQPQRAVEMAAQLRPSAVTLDIVMKPLNGWQVLPSLKSDPRTVSIPVIVVSIVDQPGMGALLGADEYIVKPVQKPALLAAVQRCLNRREPGKSKEVQNILVVEDDAPTREFISELLSKQGYTVSAAGDGEEAQACVTTSPPELIILDLILPGVSGFELLAGWRNDSQTAGIPVFVLTSKDLSREETDYLQKNTGAFFRKQEPWGDSLLKQLQRVASAAPAGQA